MRPQLPISQLASHVALADATALSRPEDLGRWYDAYAHELLRFANAFLKHDADAQDVVQEVFVKAWEVRHQFDPERGTPRAWLTVMCRSRLIDVLRRRRQRAEVPCLADDSPHASSDDRSPFDYTCGNQTRALVWRAVRGLVTVAAPSRLNSRRLR